MGAFQHTNNLMSVCNYDLDGHQHHILSAGKMGAEGFIFRMKTHHILLNNRSILQGQSKNANQIRKTYNNKRSHQETDFYKMRRTLKFQRELSLI